MAQRRMFSLRTVDTDRFLDMPCSTQSLYFHLGMRADDEGFVSSPKRITSMVGSATDDLKLLITKGFIIPFETGVCVITDWKQNNYLQNDRIQPTIYTSEKATISIDDNRSYFLVDTECIQEISKPYTQNSIDQASKDLEDSSNGNKLPLIPYQDIKNLFCSICKSYPQITKLSEARKKAIKARINAGYTVKDFEQLFTQAENSSFLKGKNDRNWQANFDWLITDKNMPKVIDGNYTDKERIVANGRNINADEWAGTSL